MQVTGSEVRGCGFLRFSHGHHGIEMEVWGTIG